MAPPLNWFDSIPDYTYPHEVRLAFTMDSDEKDICLYLRTCGGQFTSGKEISRRASGKRRYSTDPNWVFPVLTRLGEKGLVESDSTGHYRLRPPRAGEKKKKWVAPAIRQILEKTKKFDEAIKVDDPNELPE